MLAFPAQVREFVTPPASENAKVMLVQLNINVENYCLKFNSESKLYIDYEATRISPDESIYQFYERALIALRTARPNLPEEEALFMLRRKIIQECSQKAQPFLIGVKSADINNILDIAQPFIDESKKSTQDLVKVGMIFRRYVTKHKIINFLMEINITGVIIVKKKLFKG